MLRSPHFGERMAIHWLDLVRYADSIGYHGDIAFSVWPYRDYVINSFNSNKRFDVFTREQIAGDLLPNASLEERTGSAFNRLNRISTEGGVQDKEYLAKYASDRVRTTSTVWMGATLGCAECHDHKFDPYTAKDFYRFQAFFADLKEKGFYEDGYTKDDWGPKLRLPNAAQGKRLKELDEGIARLKKAMDGSSDEELAAGRRAWEKQTLAEEKAGKLEWVMGKATEARASNGVTLSLQKDGSVLASGFIPDGTDYVVKVPLPKERWTAFVLETRPDESLAGNSISRSGTTFVVSEMELKLERKPGAAGERLELASVECDFAQEGFPLEAALDGNPDTGWSVGSGPPRERRAVFRLKKPLVTETNSALVVTLRHSPKYPRQQVGRFRIGMTERAQSAPFKLNTPDNVLKFLATPEGSRTNEQVKAVNGFYRSLAPELKGLNLKLARLTAERSVLLGKIPTTLVSESTNARPIRALPRGNWMDDSGEVVTPGVPEFLSRKGMSGTNRLALADWLVSPENPLTARVFVNRLWKSFFGTGLSKTLDDLGAQGEWPTHPELLDWLATEFVERGWDVQHMVKLMVGSRAYQQSSIASQMSLERDPENRLLSRQARYRLEAELIRDVALSVSGLLHDAQGGPSARPYQPAGYFAALNFPKREYVPDVGEGQYRRGVYTHWQRTFIHPSALAFDAPSREECSVNRVNSNTPLQALVLLNDPTFVEAARVFAERVVERKGSFEKGLAWAFERTLNRKPGAAETGLLRELYENELRRFRKNPNDARELTQVGFSEWKKDGSLAETAAWTSVCRTLLNLHETITRN